MFFLNYNKIFCENKDKNPIIICFGFVLKKLDYYQKRKKKTKKKIARIENYNN